VGDSETMNTSELLVNLTHQGVQLWVVNDKLSICSPKGIITPELYAELATHKADILAFLHKTDIEALAQRLAEESEFDVSEAEIFEI